MDVNDSCTDANDTRADAKGARAGAKGARADTTGARADTTGACVDASGTRAAVRTLIAWLPAFYAMAMHAFMPDEVDEAMVIAGLIYVTAFIFSVVRPSRGLADIITRTYVVR